jgi:glucose-1-phosphate thymidylyltransferase
VIVAFADTLFKADFTLNTDQDGIIWVKKVEDPSAFGVVKTDDHGIITEFIEKPETPVSNDAIIGIYYFKDGSGLKQELKYLIDHDIRGGGEFQLTMALENLKNKSVRFGLGTVDDWLDCGNKDVTVASNARYLSFMKEEDLKGDNLRLENTVIIPPVYLGDNVTLVNSVIGPNVSVGKGSLIEHSVVENSLIQNHVNIKQANLFNSMIGNHVKLSGRPGQHSLGDFTESKI